MSDFDLKAFHLRESLFKELILIIEKIFSDKDMSFIRELIYVGEPKIALETIVAVFVEEDRIATPKIVKLIHDLAIVMRVDPELYTKPLRTKKTEFPKDWSNGKIADAVSTILADPISIRIPVYADLTLIKGKSEGVRISIVIDLSNGRIFGAFPTD